MNTIENKVIQKLIADLSINGIIFSEDQEEVNVYNIEGNIIGNRKLDNVVFQKGNITHKIYNDVFYRKGGLCTILVKNDKNEFFREMIVNDEMFYQMQKSIILGLFN